ncbi:uncharacterized protein [Solanum lycopersicum]|uniref:uncharacterized protein n=1 Tax=Solanum lycopersicum TaxID=4081 RepID=UPI000532BE19|nr:uncharacterized protein LOC104646950 [Solanum lycopersicum]
MFCCKMNQREFYVNADPLTNSAAFMATTQGKWNHRNGNQMMRVGNKGMENQSKDSGQGSLSTILMLHTYCGKTKHVHDNCYRIIGYLNYFEFTKTRENQGTVKANTVATEEKSKAYQNTQEDTTYNNYSQYMSKEQYTNLVQQVTKDFLKKHRTAPTTGFSGNAIAGSFKEEH